MPAKVIAAQIITATEVTEKLSHRVTGGVPTVVDVFGGVLILMAIAELAAKFEDSEVRTDVIVLRVRAGSIQVHLRA